MKFIYYFLCLICFTSTAFGDDPSSAKQKICLNMIVKDETQVITRGLATVKPIIDYWVIVDTGSTDGTQEMIKTFMKDIPGELHERPWKNFAHNRNEALDLAKGKADYILFIDADELLIYPSNFKMPPLSKDTYDSIVSDMGTQYDRTLLVKDGLDWKWHGVLHEFIASPRASSRERLTSIVKVSKREGNRSSDPKKYEKDALVLEEGLKSEPNNSRYVFYLAQSYRDAGNYPEALKNYQKRASMGGWDEEVFYSMLQIANLQQILNEKPEVFIKSYYDAYHYRPSRAEPLFAIAKYYRDKNDFAAGYLVASIGMTLPMPKDVLFVEKTIYDYNMELECSVDAYWIGKYDTCQSISNKILSKPGIPSHIRQVVEQNLLFANMKLVEQQRDQLPKSETQTPAELNQSKPNTEESAQENTDKTASSAQQSDSSQMNSKMPIQVAWEGSFMDLMSLSHVNRAITEELDKIPNIKLTCVGPSNANSKLSQIPELQKMARRLSGKALPDTQITVRHAWPPNWLAPAKGKWVLIQPWEFGSLPIEWVENVKRIDEVWVPTNFVKQEYVDSGVPAEKVFIVPNGIDPTIFNPAIEARKLPTQKKFKFLFLGGTIHRKGPDLLLTSYLKCFKASDDVCLVIKDFGGKGGYAGQIHDSAIKAAQNQPNAPEIIYIDDESLSSEEIASLYKACNCLIHPYRGEGFALPVLEAMACGIPVVVTAGGATDDFVTRETGWFIPSVVQPIGPTLSGMKLVKDGWLLEPDIDNLIALLPWLASHPDEVAAKGLAASEHVKKQWTWRHAAEIAAERLKALSSRN